MGCRQKGGKFIVIHAYIKKKKKQISNKKSNFNFKELGKGQTKSKASRRKEIINYYFLNRHYPKKIYKGPKGT